MFHTTVLWKSPSMIQLITLLNVVRFENAFFSFFSSLISHFLYFKSPHFSDYDVQKMVIFAIDLHFKRKKKEKFMLLEIFA